VGPVGDEHPPPVPVPPLRGAGLKFFGRPLRQVTHDGGGDAATRVAVAGGVGRARLQAGRGAVGDDVGDGVAAAVVVAEHLAEEAPDGRDRAEHPVPVRDPVLVEHAPDTILSQDVRQRQPLALREAARTVFKFVIGSASVSRIGVSGDHRATISVAATTRRHSPFFAGAAAKNTCASAIRVSDRCAHGTLVGRLDCGECRQQSSSRARPHEILVPLGRHPCRPRRARHRLEPRHTCTLTFPRQRAGAKRWPNTLAVTGAGLLPSRPSNRLRSTVRRRLELVRSGPCLPPRREVRPRGRRTGRRELAPGRSVRHLPRVPASQLQPGPGSPPAPALRRSASSRRYAERVQFQRRRKD
jgi:hypothetical protein